MNACRRNLRSATWLALFAMLALALLPTLSHAVTHAQARPGAGFAEVCTPFGMKVVALQGGDHGDEQPSSAAVHLEHCAYCGAGFGAALALPPTAPALPGPVAGGTSLPRLFLQAPRTLHVWVSARPRGPPFPI